MKGYGLVDDGPAMVDDCIMHIKGVGGSWRGYLLKNYLEIDFTVVSEEGSDIYQLLLVPWKNIVHSQNKS